MHEPIIIIRRSIDEDRPAVLELAALDSRPAPRGEALLVFVGTELRAALPLDGGEPLADPFHRTAELVDLLRLRAAVLAKGSRRRGHGRLAALRPRAA
jgi:hypothetical protein